MVTDPPQCSFSARDTQRFDDTLEVLDCGVHRGFVVLRFEKGTHDVAVSEASASNRAVGQFAIEEPASKGTVEQADGEEQAKAGGREVTNLKAVKTMP